MSTTIRPATAADVDALARVHRTAALTAYAGIFPPDAPQPTPASLRSVWAGLVADGEVLVAEVGGTVVGGAALAPDLRVPTGWTLRGLYVAPDRWRAGVGGRLHDAVLAAACRRGLTRLDLWVLDANAVARSMYERRGWTLVPGRRVVNEPADVWDVLYERAL